MVMAARAFMQNYLYGTNNRNEGGYMDSPFEIKVGDVFAIYEDGEDVGDSSPITEEDLRILANDGVLILEEA
jgi:hypothetical protein